MSYRDRREREIQQEHFEYMEKLRQHTQEIIDDRQEHIQKKIDGISDKYDRYRTTPKTMMGGHLYFDYEFPNGYNIHFRGHTAYGYTGWELTVDDIGEGKNEYKFRVPENDDEINEILKEIYNFEELDSSDKKAVKSNRKRLEELENKEN